jgi:hypothetical protein
VLHLGNEPMKRRTIMNSYLHVVVDHTGRCVNRRFAEWPRTCPSCARHTRPWRLAARAIDDAGDRIDFAFQCTHPDCRRVFVASYHAGYDDELELERTAEPWQAQQHASYA